MSYDAGRLDLERFRAAIIQRVGLQFDDARLGFLGEVLQRRLDKLGNSSDAYLWRLQHEPSAGEITALARELTVGETYFFRNIEQFRALAEVVLPERMAVDRTPKVLRLLSAGCASGEEAYSLAMVAKEAITDPAWEVAIGAVDLNPGALEKAERARYSSWALRETPPDMQRKWFHADGRDTVLDPAIRRAVKFEAANLASEDPVLWQPGTYDVVFCRNVLMYFSPDQMRVAIARIAQSLAPGDFLFLGHAETLRGISDAFHLRHTHGTFYYERKDRIGRTTPPPEWTMPRAQPRAAPVAAIGDAWFHAISRPPRGWPPSSPPSQPLSPRHTHLRPPGTPRRRSTSCAGSASLRRWTMFAPGRPKPSAIAMLSSSRRRCSPIADRSPPPRRPVSGSSSSTSSTPAPTTCWVSAASSPLTRTAPTSTTGSRPTSIRSSPCPACIWGCWHAARVTAMPPAASWRRRSCCSSAKTHRGCCCLAAASIASP